MEACYYKISFLDSIKKTEKEIVTKEIKDMLPVLDSYVLHVSSYEDSDLFDREKEILVFLNSIFKKAKDLQKTLSEDKSKKS